MLKLGISLILKDDMGANHAVFKVRSLKKKEELKINQIKNLKFLTQHKFSHKMVFELKLNSK